MFQLPHPLPTASPANVHDAGARAPFNGLPDDSCQRKQQVAEMRKRPLGLMAAKQALFPSKATATLPGRTGWGREPQRLALDRWWSSVPSA